MTGDYGIIYGACIFVVICLLGVIKFYPNLYVFIAVWWIGSVIYALVLNNIKLSVDANPWTLSVVATFFILLFPSVFGYSTHLRDSSSISSNKIIGICNVLNIWSVVLGSLLIGGSATYYLKLAEPLVVLLVEILIYGKDQLSFKHAINGVISIGLLIIFGNATHYITPPNKSDTQLLSSSLLIGAISVISVAIKVVLGSKRNEEPFQDNGFTLFLYRSVVGFKYVIGFAIFSFILDPNVFTNMIVVLPEIIMLVITQNLYNYASVEANVRNLAGAYVNGKIIKRILVLVALSLTTAHVTMSDQSIKYPTFQRYHTFTTYDAIQNYDKERIVLFGAIGRHNFGDILMAEVFEKNLKTFCDISGYNILFADVLPRNMTIYGGRDVAGITSFMNTTIKTHVVHVGGETGGCTVASAVHMINPDRNLPELSTPEWKRFSKESMLGYIVKKSFFKNPGSFVTNTIGGWTDKLNNISADFDFVSSRDYPSNKLKTFAPDSVITIREAFNDKIIAHKPNITNYVAVQFRHSENIDLISKQLVLLVNSKKFSVVFFQAGAAPGHDSLESYQKIQTNLKDQGFTNINIFSSLNVWDITSLIAHSELLIGTSLHARIIAFAFSVPRVTFSAQKKHRLMISHWDFGALNCKIAAVKVDQIFQTALSTLDCNGFRNKTYTSRATEMYREVFKTIIKTMKSEALLLKCNTFK